MKVFSLTIAIFILLGSLFGCNIGFNVETDKIVQAVMNNDLELLKSELEKGKDPNNFYKLKIDDTSVTLVQPLEEACYLKNCDAVKLFHEYGADLNSTFFSGFNSISMACLPPKLRLFYDNPPIINQQTELIEYLLEQGVNPNYVINSTGSIGYTNEITPLLLLLVELNQEETVSTNVLKLLNNGAEITPFSCLYLSAGANYFQLVDRFIEQGADLNALSSLESKTVLMTLIENATSDAKNQELYLNGASYLVSKGADFNKKDSTQKNPYEVAVEKGFTDLVDQMDSLISE